MRNEQNRLEELFINLVKEKMSNKELFWALLTLSQKELH